MFSITGWFWNRRIGRYRAFITDPKSSVILVTASRTIVVSPSDPAMFVDRVRVHFPSAQVEPAPTL